MFTELVRFKDLTSGQIDRWKELISTQAGYDSPFFHPKFTEVVSSVRSDIFVILHGSGDQIQMFWPIQKSGKSADPAGAPFADYHGPIMSADWRGRPSDILEQIGLRSFKFTSLFDPRHRFADYALERDGTFVCDLSVGADEFFETQRTLFPRHTKKMRRLARKVEREVGEMEFRFDDKDQDAFNQILSWKSRQYKETGRHDVLAPEWVRSMFQILWSSDETGCRGCFHTLKHGDKLVAGEFNLLSNKTIHGWIPAFDHEFWSYSPGYLLQDEIIKHATAVGFLDYDLGVSSEHYKKYYANFQIPVIAGSIRSHNMRSGLDSLGETAWHGLETAGIPTVSALAGKIRRRYAMIRTVETTTGDRLRGIANAASLLLHAKSEPKENLANSAD